MRKTKKKDRTSLLRKTAVVAFFLLIVSVVSIVGFKRQVGPNIDAISQLKSKGVVTEIVNKTINAKFSGEQYEKNLFLIKTGKDGKIQMVQSNTRLINELVSDFAAELQRKYDHIKPKIIKLSYGTILGSKILSQTNLGIKVKIMPMSVVKCDFETEFETQGINQTKYKIYINIESNIRVLQPFSSCSFKVKNKMLISEVVIVGDVPASYVVVPKEDILDVTNE